MLASAQRTVGRGCDWNNRFKAAFYSPEIFVIQAIRAIQFVNQRHKSEDFLLAFKETELSFLQSFNGRKGQ